MQYSNRVRSPCLGLFGACLLHNTGLDLADSSQMVATVPNVMIVFCSEKLIAASEHSLVSRQKRTIVLKHLSSHHGAA